MKSQIKILLIKTLMVVSLVGLAWMLVCPFICKWIFPNYLFHKEAAGEMALILLMPGFVPGAISTVLIMLCDEKDSKALYGNKKIKSDRINLDLEDYEQFKKCTFIKLLENGFVQEERRALSDVGEYNLLVNHNEITKVVFILAYTDVLTEEKIDEIAKDADNLYSEYKSESLSYVFCAYTLICVDKTSPYLYKYLESQNTSAIRNFYYRSAYSFGGRKLYLPSHKGTLAQSRLKQMKKFIVNMFADHIVDQSGHNQDEI